MNRQLYYAVGVVAISLLAVPTSGDSPDENDRLLWREKRYGDH